MIQLSESDGPVLPDTALTPNERWLQNVLNHHDVLALICTHQASDLYGISSAPLCNDKQRATYLRWTYRDLDRAIQLFANGLKARGLGKGDPLLIFMANIAEYVIATWAAYRIGCVHVPINPKNLSNTVEPQHMFQTVMNGCHSGTLATIAGNFDLCAPIEKLTSGLNCMKILVEGQRDGWTSFGDLMQKPAEYGQDVRCKDAVSEPLESSLLFTSGTTSLPKGCCLETSSYPFTVATGWNKGSQPVLPGDKFVHVLPNNHCYSYMYLMSCFVNAATVVFPGSNFVPETLIQVIQQEKCNHVALVPTMVLALSVVPLASEQKLNSLRRVELAGAPPSEEIIRVCLKHLGASGVQNIYGMTEGVLAHTDATGHASDIVVGSKVSIGMPFPGAKIRICAEDSRIPLPVGMAGEVHFSGPTLIKGYIGRADDDKFYTEEDGRKWFRTGDKAIMDKNNQLYLVGRYKDTIIRGGENIEPSAIEAVLGQIPEFYVLEPQVVRFPNHVAGEVPIVVVNCQISQETARQLKDTILAKMGTMYVPMEVISVQSLGSKAFPRTMGGKVQKSKLEDMVKSYWRERQSKIHANLSSAKLADSTNSQSIVELCLGSRINESFLSAIAVEKDIQIDPTTRMIDLGVDSILCVTILRRVQKEAGVSLPSSLFFAQTTVGAISDRLCSISCLTDLLHFSPPKEDASRELCFSTLIQGAPKPGVPSLFLTPTGNGSAFSYRSLPKFANDLAVYALGSPFLMTNSEATWTVEEAAAIYVKAIRSLQAQGPYILGGWSMGGITAYEVAFQLHQQGERVLGIINIDMPFPMPIPINIPEPTIKLLDIIGFFPPLHEIFIYPRQHSLSSVRARMNYSARPINNHVNGSPVRIFLIWAGHGDCDRLPSMLCEANNILKEYGPQTQKKTDQAWLQTPRKSFDAGGWAEMVGGENVECHVIEHATHDSMMTPEVVCSPPCILFGLYDGSLLNDWHRCNIRRI